MFALAFLLALLGPPDFQESFRSGLLALTRGETVQARSYLENACKLQPDNAQVWVALARTYWKLHQNRLAGNAAMRAQLLGPQDPAVLHGLAIYYSDAGDPDKAADCEARYSALAPQDRDGPLRVMSLYLSANQPGKAIAAAHAAPDQETRADLRHLLGKAYALTGKFDESAAELRAAVRLNPYDEAYLFDLADLFLRREKFGDAIQVLNQGRETFDKSPQIELALGVAYYGLRRFPEAAEQFLKTIALAPEVEQPYVFLGKMLDQAGPRLPEITQRFIDFEKARPENYLGYLLHAKALAAQSADIAAIEPLLRRAIALNEREWESHFELGAMLERNRAFEEAAKELGSAAALNPKASTPHYHLARVYDRLGKSGAATAERALHAKLSANNEGR